ncbi:MAG: hypothetical protein HS132_18190 [Planctomycetia bacterium]|nr:hypothetical protein [Planctomycetia bacterium]
MSSYNLSVCAREARANDMVGRIDSQGYWLTGSVKYAIKPAITIRIESLWRISACLRKTWTLSITPQLLSALL